MKLLQKAITFTSNIYRQRRINRNQVIFTLIVIFLFFSNTWHEKYPDEFDNILGGRLTLEGLLIYKDWFTHHGPVPYFIAAILEIFSGQSFVRFRIIYSIFLLSLTMFGYFYVVRSVGKKIASFYPFLIIFVGFLSTYYWLHMLLADSLSAFLIFPAYILIMLKSFYKKTFTLLDLSFISISLSLVFYSSLAYTYLLAITILFVLFEYYSSSKFKYKSVKSYYPFVIFSLPHIFYFLYLLISGSLNDYFYQAINFNTQYYIYNYPRPEGQSFINPIRYAVVIAYSFISEFYTLILGAFKFEFSFPMNLAMAMGNVIITAFLILKKKYRVALFVVLVLIYANSRSNPLESKETDYQSAVYILLSFVNIFLVLPKLYDSVNDSAKDMAKRAIYIFLLIIMGIHLTFASLFVLRKYVDKIYPKYMGKAPLIYDRPEIAPILNAVLSKDDYTWVGPFYFEETFYTKAKPATKYQILIPGIGKSERIQKEMIQQISKTRPKIIVFDKNFYVLGNRAGSYGEFFMKYLEKNYITLLEYRNGDKVYRSLLPVGGDKKVDLETKFYIRKDVVMEIVKRLIQNNYIEERSS